MALTVEQFGKSLVSSGVLSVDELKSIWSSLPADQRPRDAEQFAKLLRERGKLSDYQAQVALQGKANALVFSKYILVTQLGAGASGQVFRAKHRQSGRDVAIKILAAEIAKDEKAVKRFYREVQATAKLAHPNIVRAVDAGEYNGQHHLVMEYVAGRDLSSFVKANGPLGVDDALKTILQAARGLEYAHGQGLIHRDVKPGNFLRDETDGTVRLLDLGLVRFEDSGEATGDGLTGTQQVMGTIDYMSPEQVVDTRHADARCDIYSLGCTLYFLMTGKKLYDAKGVVERIMQHRIGAIPSLVAHRKEIPARLDALYQKMVAKQPADRYQTMTEVCDALERIIKGEPDPEPAAAEGLLDDASAMVEAADDVSLTNLPTAAMSFGTAVVEAPAPAVGGFAINTAAAPHAVGKRSTQAQPKATTRLKLDKKTLYLAGGVAAVLVIIVAAYFIFAG
jgi:serine/threonine protein kinase